MNKALAAQLEGCIKQIHMEVTRRYAEGVILEIGGGAACYSGSDSYLSHVAGWGFATKKSQFADEIGRIESFYRQQNYPHVDIELCPFAGNELALWLSARGYRVTELNQVSALDLTSYIQTQHDAVDSFIIRAVLAHELQQWAKQVARGFDYLEAEEQFLRYAQIEGAQAFAAFDAEKIVAGALVAVQGNCADLGLASTLPAYRGLGIQKKLIETRLNYAKNLGVSWAMVSTEPGSISDANVQKSGFYCVYTRIKMTRELSAVHSV